VNKKIEYIWVFCAMISYLEILSLFILLPRWSILYGIDVVIIFGMVLICLLIWIFLNSSKISGEITADPNKIDIEKIIWRDTKL
jgi:hypothetical protein